MISSKKALGCAYKPHEGFFDLTIKPDGMSKKEHQQIQRLQMIIIAEAEKFSNAQVRKNNQRVFNELRDYAAQLQQVIIRKWPPEMLFK